MFFLLADAQFVVRFFVFVLFFLFRRNIDRASCDLLTPTAGRSTAIGSIAFVVQVSA